MGLLEVRVGAQLAVVCPFVFCPNLLFFVQNGATRDLNLRCNDIEHDTAI
jgi:hypothetical protein